MDLFSLIIVLVIIGVVLWAVNTFIPMQPQIKQIMNTVVIILVLIWVLSLFIGYLPNPKIGR